MHSTIPKIPAAPEPAKTPAKLPETASPASHLAPKPAERRPAFDSLSSADVAYVKSLMGLLPAQKMDEVLLRTGIPMPANLGLDVDTAV